MYTTYQNQDWRGRSINQGVQIMPTTLLLAPYPRPAYSPENSIF